MENKSKETAPCPACGEPLCSDGRCYNNKCKEYDPLSQYFDGPSEEELTTDVAKLKERMGMTEDSEEKFVPDEALNLKVSEEKINCNDQESKKQRKALIKLLNHQFGVKVSEIVADWLIQNGTRVTLSCENCEHYLSSVGLCRCWESVTENDGFCHRAKPREESEDASNV